MTDEAGVPPRAVLPVLPWTAQSRWRPTPVGAVLLLAGLWLFGTGEAMLVDAHLGNSPWVVLAEGISRHTALDIGAATFATSLVVLLCWVPLRERPGLGTLANAVVIAVAIDVMLPVLPSPAGVPLRLGESLGAVVVIGVGSALYLTTGLGPGPRDGWMTGIGRRTGWSLHLVRLGIESTVLVGGFLLGGQVGVGTVLFAVLIGRSVTTGLGLVARLDVTVR